MSSNATTKIRRVEKTTPTSPDLLAGLSPASRYENLENTHGVGDIPDFREQNTHKTETRTFVDDADAIQEMAEWLDKRINAGEDDTSWNDDYRTVRRHSNISFHKAMDLNTLPKPQEKDLDGLSYISVDVSGMVHKRIRDPTPASDAAQSLFNFIAVFAQATGAEIQTRYSELPEDHFEIYLLYNFN